MNKITKNVSVIICHESDTPRPVPANPEPGPEILLVDKNNGSFEIQSLGESGAVPIAPKEVSLCVLTSDIRAIIAEEPSGTTFSLKKAEGVQVGAQATITVTVTWEKVSRPPSTFQLAASVADDDKIAVALVDSPDAAFIDADIRSTSPAAPAPQQSTIRADDARAKRKAEIEAKAKKPVPHAAPTHPVVEPEVLHTSEPHPVRHHAVHEEPTHPKHDPKRK